MKNFLYILLMVIAAACSNKEKAAGAGDEPVYENLNFEGRFVKIEQINAREYYLYLQDTSSDNIRFLTLMPLRENEISMLKPQGNNIILVYHHFYNPVKKLDEKVVTAMTPKYEFKDR